MQTALPTKQTHKRKVQKKQATIQEDIPQNKRTCNSAQNKQVTQTTVNDLLGIY